MADLLEIQKAINRHLKALYPEYKVYLEEAPQGFVRPSFFICLISSMSNKMGASSYTEETPLWQIVFFPSGDNPNKEELACISGVKDSLLETFYLSAGDGKVIQVLEPVTVQKLDGEMSLILRTKVFDLNIAEGIDTYKINRLYLDNLKKHKEHIKERKR